MSEASSSGSGSWRGTGCWDWSQRPISAVSSAGISELLNELFAPPLGFGESGPPSSGVFAAITLFRLPEPSNPFNLLSGTTRSRRSGFGETVYIG
jgi:hypothetical protein